jgi:DNA/RNA-binding domain of Phe-tRNA-synthetase-like protein
MLYFGRNSRKGERILKKLLKIDEEMKRLWPAVRVGCFQYKVKIEKKNEDMWTYLKKDIYKKTKNAIFDYGVNDIPNIKQSRMAYKAFGKDPSRYRVSSEALIRRIGQGKGLYEVNTVVDVNNLISVESGFSAGSYDADKIGDELIFRVGREDETYQGIGKDEVNIANLPVLSDYEGAVGSSTSDSRRAMITEDTKEVLTLIYSFSDNDDLEKAIEYGEEYLVKYAGAQEIISWIVK